MTVFLYSAA